MSKSPDRSPSRLPPPKKKKKEIIPSFSSSSVISPLSSSSYSSSSHLPPFSSGHRASQPQKRSAALQNMPNSFKIRCRMGNFYFLAILRHTSRPFVLGSTLIFLLQRRHRKKEKEEKKNKEPQELRQWTFQQPKAKRRLRGPRGKEKTKTIFH